MTQPGKPLLARSTAILICVVVMACGVWFVGERIRHRSAANAVTLYQKGRPLEAIRTAAVPVQARIFSTPLLVDSESDISIRDLKTYYDQREYHGAPPPIPHDVDADMELPNRCNVCHERGGFVERFNAFTPLTPHPQYENCMQCHVPEQDHDLFRAAEWQSVQPPKLQRTALPGSPPPIPHTLQLRDDCLSCHAGPAAPIEIRTSHPERENCLQCHVASETDILFDRSVGFERMQQAEAIGHVPSE